ncbi:MAG: hypothetical protein JWO69_2052 [Thermoleophilia bacterium]|nr:hypothetical protein [Thermoleophilia bacterium]
MIDISTSAVACSEVAVYLTFRLLPQMSGPGRIARRPGKTLVALDPRHTRIEVATFSVDNLSATENAAMRRGWGIGTACPEWMVTDDLCVLYVPPPLRLTDGPPLQGGAELVRRYHAGDLDLELSMLEAEVAANGERVA